MPRLLVFVPCERVIVSQDDNSATLIALLQSVKLEAPEEAPDTIVAPVSWSAFALWYRLPEDEGVDYEQRIQLVAPSGKILLEQVTPFRMTKAYHRNTHRSFGLPVAAAGEYILRLSIRRVGDEFNTVSEFPWPIQRVTSAAAVRA